MSVLSVSYYLILSEWIWLPGCAVWWVVVDYSLRAIADTFRGPTVIWMDESGPWCGSNKNGPIGAGIWMLAHQRVELFKWIAKIWRCGLVGAGVSLGVGFEVSKAQAQPRVCLCCWIRRCLSATWAPRLPAAVFSTVIIMEEDAETVKQVPN